MAYDPLPLGPRLLGRRSLDMNTTDDQPITISLPPGSAKYAISRIIITNASASLTLAAGGLYTGAGKSGSAVVAAAQAYSALTGSEKVLNPTIAITDVRTELTLNFALTVAQGAAATADIYVIGDAL